MRVQLTRQQPPAWAPMTLLIHPPATPPHRDRRQPRIPASYQHHPVNLLPPHYTTRASELGSHDDLCLGNALVELAHLESAQGLEETGAVVGPRAILVLEHLLGDLAVKFGGGVGQVRLHVNELLQLVELAVHLQYGHLLAEEGVGAVEELDARVRARKLAATGDPRDGGALIEQVGGLKIVHTLLHDHAHAQDLTLVVVGDELRGEHLDDHVGEGLLGIHKGVKVGLARFDGSLNGLQRVAALGHVALDLPRELDIVGDV
mmetsp:Transcript_1364/g.2031  ORF Transcript_1364/g.2031 Transcript_1364/m.2031 type:complete len:261 (-) Transcript_1364:656-1438(-)